MSTSIDVAAALIRQCGPLPTMKLQKLSFLANAYHLAYTGERLIDEDPRCWKTGPVYPKLYAVHKDLWTVETKDLTGAKPLSNQGVILLEAACKAHAGMSGKELGTWLLSTAPVDYARRHATKKDPKPVIDDDWVAQYFRARLEAPSTRDEFAERFSHTYTSPLNRWKRTSAPADHDTVVNDE